MSTDLQSLIARSARLDLEGIDFTRFADEPLDAASLRCLRYMHDVESHTMCYLRDVLVTRAHADPEVTAFLAAWAYEEHWHGDAIASVLDAHAEEAGLARVRATRRSLPRRDRLRPMAFLAASLLSRHVVAVHMAWGAVNEWTTQAAYVRLAKRAGHPVLSELLRRITKQEGRHIDFYAEQARRRLAGSERAQFIVRHALEHWWEPVGAGIMGRAELAFLVTHLFGDDEGASVAARLDRHIDRLPGLAGLRLVQGAVAGLRAAAR
jgi:hypothetical protein